ncbi:MAG: hypothetical protein KGL11_04395 [Alphaproteobacteria bacterium]|nr:hypothetical protein [Alphaproteobacteria bacterium]
MLEAWHDLYVMLGSSAAALIGLLFVATSLHLDDIIANQVYRHRARNIALHLLALLVQATAILAPQPMTLLGLEICAVNLLGLSIPITFTHRAFIRDRELGRRGGSVLSIAIAYMAGYLTGVVGGAALFFGAGWGLYLVTAAFVDFLVSVIVNAWAVMLGLRSPEEMRK